MNTREMARKAVREQIALAALKCFKEKGFESTTVEAIASDIGMSTRTYFRYFRSKDDVLLETVLSFTRYFLGSFERALETEDIWNALRIGMEDASANCRKGELGRRGPEVQNIIQHTPALLARQLEIVERLQIEATTLYLSKCPNAEAFSWSTANAIIRSAFACMQAAQHHFPVESEHMIEELGELMRKLRPAILCTS